MDTKTISGPIPTPEFSRKSWLGDTGVSSEPSTHNLKRRHVGSDSSGAAHPFHRESVQKPYVLIKSKDTNKKISSLSVFIISKTLTGIAGEPESVKKLASGDLLVQCKKTSHVDNLLKINTFAGVPCEVELHQKLNQSKGVVRSRDLEGCSEEEIQSEIEGVVHARRMKTRRDGKLIDTNTVILTFDSCRPPKSVKAGYLLLKVAPYVPNPLRCFKCQRFGHGQTNCHKKAVCPRCGNTNHEEKDCTASPKCPNCQGEHTAFSKECPIWKQERSIQAYKAEHGCSFIEARKMICPTTTVPPARTFANVTRKPQTSSRSIGTSTAEDRQRPAVAASSASTSSSSLTGTSSKKSSTIKDRKTKETKENQTAFHLKLSNRFNALQTESKLTPPDPQSNLPPALPLMDMRTSPPSPGPLHTSLPSSPDSPLKSPPRGRPEESRQIGVVMSRGSRPQRSPSRPSRPRPRNTSITSNSGPPSKHGNDNGSSTMEY